MRTHFFRSILRFSTLALFLAATLCAEDNPKDMAIELGRNIRLNLVLIPAGTFEMGTPEKEPGHKKNETLHTVTLTKPFYMGIKEVTQEQYEAVMFENPSKNKGPTLPVDRVTWEDASKFCEKLSEKSGLNIQLPTEAQWEYACRAGTKTAYHTGESITTGEANFNGEIKNGSEKGDNRDRTLAAGAFKPNAFGLYDMHGNVWEWCRDWYDENYYSAPDANSGTPAAIAPNPAAPGTTPPAPTTPNVPAPAPATPAPVVPVTPVTPTLPTTPAPVTPTTNAVPPTPATPNATSTTPGSPAAPVAPGVPIPPITDPEGPEKSSENPPVRVVRGGSYYSITGEMRSGTRDSLAPGYRSAHGGFRVIVQVEK